MTHSWQAVFRALCQHAPPEGITRLYAALVEDSPRLIQGQSFCPAPAPPDWPTEGLCPICTLFASVGCAVYQAENAFGFAAYTVGDDLGDSVAAFRLIDWIDTVPRAEMRRGLLRELEPLVKSFVDSVVESLNERNVMT